MVGCDAGCKVTIVGVGIFVGVGVGCPVAGCKVIIVGVGLFVGVGVGFCVGVGVGFFVGFGVGVGFFVGVGVGFFVGFGCAVGFASIVVGCTIRWETRAPKYSSRFVKVKPWLLATEAPSSWLLGSSPFSCSYASGIPSLSVSVRATAAGWATMNASSAPLTSRLVGSILRVTGVILSAMQVAV